MSESLLMMCTIKRARRQALSEPKKLVKKVTKDKRKKKYPYPLNVCSPLYHDTLYLFCVGCWKISYMHELLTLHKYFNDKTLKKRENTMQKMRSRFKIV